MQRASIVGGPWIRGPRIWLAASLLLLLTACATTARLPALPPQTGIADVHRLIRAHDAQDARFQVITDHPYLQIDLRHRYQLPAYYALPDVAAREAFVQRFLAESGALADQSISLALARVPPDALAQFARENGLAIDGSPQDALREAVLSDQHAHLQAELARVAGLKSAVELDHYWRELVAHVEASIMTRGKFARRVLTAPAVPFISAWIGYHNRHDYRGPVAPDFGQSIEFTPALGADRPPAISAGDWALLQQYAPVIVQEQSDGSAYPAYYDRFGTVSLVETADDVAPVVDADAPALYAFVDEKPIQGRPVRQLVYTLWFPQHPKMKGFDPEAGPLDGWTIRVSLNARDVPLVVESVSNCGCYYKIFPSSELEARAAAVFPAPLDGKTLRVEQHLADRFDAVVPETVALRDATPQNLVLYFSAGHHQLVTVRTQATRAGHAPQASARYALRAYDELEHLPARGREMGLFGEDGLVRSAHRGECNLLSPSGLYHAGHPRQRETQMIYFDEADFDDPALLERYLRLPPDAFGAST